MPRLRPAEEKFAAPAVAYTVAMTIPYEIRSGGEGKSKKQSMAELKLRRLMELNARLREDLERRRIPVSEAAME